MAGRPPKNPIEKELLGNPGKRPIKKSAPVRGMLAAPKSLTKDAQVVWKNIVGAMPRGTFQATDATTLAILCQAVADYWTAHAQEQAHGRYEPDARTGRNVLAPWVKDKNEQARLIYTYSQRLYLDPVARNSLLNSAPEDDEDDNPFVFN